MVQALGPGPIGVKGAAADVFFDDCALLLEPVGEEILLFKIKQIGVRARGMFGGGLERVIAGAVAVLPLPDVGKFMADQHR